MFGSVLAILIAWVDHLTKKSNHKTLDPTVIVGCHDFIKALRATPKLFSNNLFIITFLMSAGLIVTTYRAIAIFIGDYVLSWIMMAMIAGHFCLSLLSAFSMIYFAYLEDELQSGIEELTYALINHDTKECRIINNHLQNFKGFPAMNFFYVNKSFLSSFFTASVAYLIILLQFRVGEETGKNALTTI